jgi:hypothetical protein
MSDYLIVIDVCTFLLSEPIRRLQTYLQSIMMVTTLSNKSSNKPVTHDSMVNKFKKTVLCGRNPVFF